MIVFGSVLVLFGGVILAMAVVKIQNQGLVMVFPAFLFSVFFLVIGLGLILGGVKVSRRATPLGQPEPAYSEYPGQILVPQEVNGLAYHKLYVPPVKGKNGRPSALLFLAPTSGQAEFEIVRRSWIDRVGVASGLAREVETGDPDFNSAFYVRSNTPDYVRHYLAEPSNRTAIEELMGLGFQKVTMKDQQITAEWTGFDPQKNHHDGLSQLAGSRVLSLGLMVPEDPPAIDSHPFLVRTRWKTAFWVFLLAFAATVASLFLYTPVNFSQMIPRSVNVLVMGLPSFLLLAFVMIRGTSRSHYIWGLLALCSLFLFPVGSVGIVGLLNGALDRSPVQGRWGTIVRKYVTRGKSTSYHVVCESWQKPGERLDFHVSSSLYDSVREGQSRLKVYTHQGYFGIEWYTKKEVDINPVPLPVQRVPPLKLPRFPRPAGQPG